MDFVEGLPNSEGREVIFVVVDRLTKYSHSMGMRHPSTARGVAQVFVEHVYKLHGMPLAIVSDRDPVFTSTFWQELFRIQGVALNLCTAYHPQTDGQTEVVNRCLGTYLRCMSGDEPKHWYRWLALAEWWYNTTFHSSLNLTLFEALYGYAPPLHLPYLAGQSVVQQVDSDLGSREEMLQLLKHHLERAQQRMKAQADKHRTDRSYEIGDLVYLKLQPFRRNSLADRQCRKLSAKYFGPYKIIDKIGVVAYKLELPENAQIHHVFHISQLKKKIGPAVSLGTELPSFGGITSPKPVSILARRMVKRGNRVATQVLILWANSFPEDATWEYLYDLQQKFPDFPFES